MLALDRHYFPHAAGAAIRLTGTGTAGAHIDIGSAFQGTSSMLMTYSINNAYRSPYWICLIALISLSEQREDLKCNLYLHRQPPFTICQHIKGHAFLRRTRKRDYSQISCSRRCAHTHPLYIHIVKHCKYTVTSGMQAFLLIKSSIRFEFSAGSQT